MDILENDKYKENLEIIKKLSNIEYMISVHNNHIKNLINAVNAINTTSYSSIIKNNNSNTNSKTDNKRRKITYDEQKLNDSLQNNYYYDRMRIIVNSNTHNFGRIIGKEGRNLKSLESRYNVNIYVPSSQDAKIFNNIIILKKRYGNLDEAEEEIKKILNSN